MGKQRGGWAIGVLVLWAVASACSSNKPAAKIDNGALVRLNEQQMQPVDESRIEEGRARDQQARAHAGGQDARSKLAVAKAEREVAAANSNEVRGMNGASIDQKLAEAQLKESQLRKQVAERRVELVDSYNKWQELDARLRTMPQPERVPVPSPTQPAEPTRP